jgi:hypothetical protein
MIRTRLSPCRAKRGALPVQTVTSFALSVTSVLINLWLSAVESRLCSGTPRR